MLFWKEGKKVICSLTFVLYAITVIAMYWSQFGTQLDAPITQPQPGLEYYGTVEREVPEVLLPAATEGLVSEYLSGSYVAYPFGLYKEVKLNEKDSTKLAEIIEELTGISKQELDNFTEYEAGGYVGTMDANGNPTYVYKEPVLPEMNIPTDLSYEHFKELMLRVDEIIGGGSKYSEKYIVNNFSRIPMTYEDALAEYEELMKGNNIAEGYMRLYCDYLGIILGIMPIFACVSLWQLDKKSQMEQLIYSRKISSVQIIGTRYLALVSSMVIPVVLTFVHALMGINSLYPNKDIDFGSAIAISALWLMPSILIVSGVGVLVSELISPFPAIFVQGVWWYISLEMNQLTGSITKWTLIIRHNTMGSTELFNRQFGDFVWNRTCYTILSLVVVGITMLIYEKKRKGVYHGKRMLRKNRKHESEA